MPIKRASDFSSLHTHFGMIPGIPVEADETLTLKTMGAALKAAEDAQAKFAALGQKLAHIRIWHYKLIAKGEGNVAFVYLLPCGKCRKKRRKKRVDPVYT